MNAAIAFLSIPGIIVGLTSVALAVTRRIPLTASAALGAAGNALMCAGNAMQGLWPFAAINGAAAVFIAWTAFRDWWNRKGKRAARQLGAKSRARVLALVSALRDTGMPLPQGAR